MTDRERLADELALDERISAVLIAHGVWTDPDDWHTDEDREDLLVALIGAALLREQEREPDALRVVARRLSYPKVITESPSDERAILEYRVQLSVAEYRAAMKALS